MWSRSQLKERAKNALRQNYWKTVLVTLIVFMIGGATTTFNFSSSSSDSSDSDFFSDFEQIWENNFGSDSVFQFDTIYMITGGESEIAFDEIEVFPDEDLDIDLNVVPEMSDMEYSELYYADDASDEYWEGYYDGYFGEEKAVTEASDYSDGYNDGVLDDYVENYVYGDSFYVDDFYDSDIVIEDEFGSLDSYLGNDAIWENSRVMAIAGIVVVVLFIVGVIALILEFLLSVLIYNPLEVGTERFFINNLNQPAEVKEITYAFDHSYKNVISILFTRDLCIIGWTLLFVIPGIVKMYEYQMIPYLLAENPNLTKEQAFALSKQMMTGNKWNAFILDVSFIGWDFLSACTLGILAIFYVQPYKKMTGAALYEELSAINGRPAFSYQKVS